MHSDPLPAASVGSRNTSAGWWAAGRAVFFARILA